MLRINGDAPNTALERCMGGGYKFKFITAELIDLQTEETLGTYSNSGFSEDCAPLSGTIFGDIARMVASVFR
ncbi:MAG TPA: hypothetical protein VMI56_28010 [Reyranella sp.]|nr:hypothetical protein [Reyranella sp.]